MYRDAQKEKTRREFLFNLVLFCSDSEYWIDSEDFLKLKLKAKSFYDMQLPDRFLLF